MRLSDWPCVEALIAERAHLISQRDYAPIAIIIGGSAQSAEFVDHVTPRIKLELRHQIEAVDQQLVALGIEIDSAESTAPIQLRA